MYPTSHTLSIEVIFRPFRLCRQVAGAQGTWDLEDTEANGGLKNRNEFIGFGTSKKIQWKKSETNPKLLKFVVFGFGNWTKVAFKVAECSNSTMCSKDHTHGPMQVLEHLTSWSQEGVNSTKSSWQEVQLENKIKTTRINWTNCFTKTYSNSKISKTPSTWHDALEWITPDLFLFRTSQVHVPYPATEDCNHCSSKIDG